jgi:hypothetical protein
LELSLGERSAYGKAAGLLRLEPDAGKDAGSQERNEKQLREQIQGRSLLEQAGK